MNASQQGVSAAELESISTLDHIDSPIGKLEFVDGAPSEETAALLYDQLVFMHGWRNSSGPSACVARGDGAGSSGSLKFLEVLLLATPA